MGRKRCHEKVGVSTKSRINVRGGKSLAIRSTIWNEVQGSSNWSRYSKYVHSMSENRVSSATTKIQFMHGGMQ